MLIRFLFVHFTLYLSVDSLNLICNGDFEAYKPIYLYENSYYKTYYSDPNCWYGKNSLDYEVKYYFNVTTTNGADLITLVPIKLCQNVVTLFNKSYTLSYDLFCQKGFYNMQMSVEWNGVVIDQLSVPTGNSFGSSSIQIITQENVNQLCFSETHNTQVLYLTGIFVGGLLDNVSLVPNFDFPESSNASNTSNTPYLTENTVIPIQIEDQQFTIQGNKMHYIIYFNKTVEERFGRIVLSSNLTYQPTFYDIFSTNLVLYLSNQQQEKYQMNRNQKGELDIVLYPQRSYQLDQIQLFIKNFQTLAQSFSFEAYVDGVKINFNLLSQNDKKIIDAVEPIAITMAEIIKSIYVYFSASLSSFFILNLFSFWNLALMYNFLFLWNVPIFTRNIYEIMISMLYEEGSFVGKFIQLCNLSQDALEPSYSKTLPENMEQFYEGYSWFGLFGFSTKFFPNNSDNFAALAILIVKLLLLKIIFITICKKISRILEININYCAVFLVQILSLSPFFLVSGVELLLISYGTFFAKMDKIFQIMVIFMCLMNLPLLVIQQNKRAFRDYHKKQKVMKQQLQKSNKIYLQHFTNHKKIYDYFLEGCKKKLGENLQKEKIEICYEITEMIPQLTIPIFICLKHTLIFLSLHLLFYIFRAIYLVKKLKHMEIKDKIFRVIMMLVWLIYHGTFFFFYLLSVFSEQQIFEVSQRSRMCVICGVMVLMLLILGAGVQLLKLFVDIVIFLVSTMKKIIQKCKKSQIVPEQLVENKGKQQSIKQKEKQNAKINKKKKRQRKIQKQQKTQKKHKKQKYQKKQKKQKKLEGKIDKKSKPKGIKLPESKTLIQKKIQKRTPKLPPLYITIIQQKQK